MDVYYNGKRLDDIWMRELNGIATMVAGEKPIKQTERAWSTFVESLFRREKPRNEAEVDVLITYVFLRALKAGSLSGDLQGRLDGMNAQSEITSLRLQMTMDRRVKFISTLSNIMRKIGTTQETITQNIK
jgi:hypothetical protein